MDNPEHCQLWAHEIEGAINNGQSRALSTLGTRDWRSNQEWTIQRNCKINVRENRRDNQECTIQSTVNFRHTRLKVDSALDGPFLIVPTVFSNVYLSVSLDCQFLISPSISCSQGLQCSGLSILDCSFNLVCPKLTVLWIVHSWLSSLRFSLTFICQCLWIVHSWLLLQSRVPNVDSALDCPFLIVPSISCVQSSQCSGLSILDCSFNLVCPRLTVLWIVHSWLLLQSRVPKVDSALDCPLLIAPSISCVQS